MKIIQSKKVLSKSTDCPQRDNLQLHLHVPLINENQHLFRREPRYEFKYVGKTSNYYF